MAGPPFAYYHAWSEQEIDMECGFPALGAVKDDGGFKAFILPSVRADVAMHTGPYSDIVKTYTEVQKWMKENAHQPADQMWEIYLNDPAITPPDKLMTQIVWPLK
jgi:effector-binding domain-containing protein